jgi:hypothetical protein
MGLTSGANVGPGNSGRTSGRGGVGFAYKPESRFHRPTQQVIGPTELVPVLRDPVLDIAIKYAVQLGAHVYVQIAAGGFDQVRFGYASGLSFPSAVMGEMLRRIFVGNLFVSNLPRTFGRNHRTALIPEGIQTIQLSLGNAGAFFTALATARAVSK